MLDIISKSSTIYINKIARFTISILLTAHVGGRIYYVDSTASGGEYHFYDANGNELATHTVDGLASAVTYYAKSKADKDKFYTYATTDGSPSSNILMSNNLKFDKVGMSEETTTNTRGSGKTNSAMLINKLGGTSNTIWNWLKTQRDSNLNGCNDWFIGSMVELNDLRTGSTSGSSAFSGNFIWSSVEYSASNAYLWNHRVSSWDIGADADKTSTHKTIALRSF